MDYEEFNDLSLLGKIVFWLIAATGYAFLVWGLPFFLIGTRLIYGEWFSFIDLISGIRRKYYENKCGKDGDIIERLAALEHEQWAHWTRYMLDNLTPENIERWNRQIQTSYSDLTEDEKDSDREWAVKAMDLYFWWRAND